MIDEGIAMIHIDLVADWINQAIIKLSTAVANGYSIDDSWLNYVLANPTAGTDDHVVSLGSFSRKTGDSWIEFICDGNPYRFDCLRCIVTRSHL